MSDIIDEIEHLPHFREFKCTKCSTPIRIHALQIYANCPQCGLEHKCRRYGAVGTEVQDVIDAVLIWAGRGESFDAVMKWREEIITDSED